MSTNENMQNWVKRGHVTQFWIFGTPLISRGSMKLEISNLAQRWMAVSANEKIQNLVKRGHVGSLDPILDFWDPPNILGTNKARNFKFGIYMDGSEC